MARAPGGDRVQHRDPAHNTVLASHIAIWRAAILSKLAYALGKKQANATDRDWFLATSLAVRDCIVDQWISPAGQQDVPGRKRIYYLSIEYLIGRLLFDAMSNLGVNDVVQEALRTLGVDVEQVREMEADPALGNGGLGRLAACFMDSMATLQIAAVGYGIRYRYGLFRQQIVDGVQEERPDNWLAAGNPWEFERREVTYPVSFGGMCDGFDTVYYMGSPQHVNALRLWSARVDNPVGPSAATHIPVIFARISSAGFRSLVTLEF
jgi:starch phosphorylase